jgi:hypothetical protein
MGFAEYGRKLSVTKTNSEITLFPRHSVTAARHFRLKGISAGTRVFPRSIRIHPFLKSTEDHFRPRRSDLEMPDSRATTKIGFDALNLWNSAFAASPSGIRPPPNLRGAE